MLSRHLRALPPPVPWLALIALPVLCLLAHLDSGGVDAEAPRLQGAGHAGAGAEGRNHSLRAGGVDLGIHMDPALHSHTQTDSIGRGAGMGHDKV